MKKFTVPCDFGGKKAPFDVYIGNPKPGMHPLHYQYEWLEKERGGQIPQEVMESFAKLLVLSEKNGVPFEDLCVYALKAANAEKESVAKGMKENNESDTKMKEIKAMRILAKPVDLNQFFEEEFYLLQFQCKNRVAEIYQVVLLIKAERILKLKLFLEKEEIILEDLSKLGKIELLLSGTGPVDSIGDLLTKYKISIEKAKEYHNLDL